MPVEPINLFARLDDLRENFPVYVNAFNAKTPFSESQLMHHLRTINLRRTFSSASNAASDARFADSLADTLRAWDIGVPRHGMRIVQPTKFREELRSISLATSRLEHLRIDDTSLDARRTASLIWRILAHLNIVTTKSGDRVERKVVSGTKALHHLLPDLVFPVDNEYTGTFFGFTDFGRQQEERFTLVFDRVAEVARAVAPREYLTDGWHSGISKVLDNAIVGYCRSHGLMSVAKKNKRKNNELSRRLRQILEQTGRYDECMRLLRAGRADELNEILKQVEDRET